MLRRADTWLSQLYATSRTPSWETNRLGDSPRHSRSRSSPQSGFQTVIFSGFPGYALYSSAQERIPGRTRGSGNRIMGNCGRENSTGVPREAPRARQALPGHARRRKPRSLPRAALLAAPPPRRRSPGLRRTWAVLGVPLCQPAHQRLAHKKERKNIERERWGAAPLFRLLAHTASSPLWPPSREKMWADALAQGTPFYRTHTFCLARACTPPAPSDCHVAVNRGTGPLVV